MTKTYYASAYETRDGYRGYIYHYDENGEDTTIVYRSPRTYESSEYAVDEAIEEAEKRGYDYETEFPEYDIESYE